MSFRALHDELLQCDGRAPLAEVLWPWAEQNPAHLEWLHALRIRGSTAIPAVSEDDLWELYAASRVFEVLALGFQEGQADGSDWPGPELYVEEFAGFARRLGFDVIQHAGYSPFHHEIAGMSSTAAFWQRPRVTRHLWPCLMLGSMLFMRGGVAVCAGSNHLRPGIADQSTLYWAHRRKTRPCHDLAHGWGHNSSWRTAFRRDYHLDGRFHFNVDGNRDLSTLKAGSLDEYGLDPRERKELVAHRCFVTTAKDDRDLFPYNDGFSMPAA